MPTITAGIAGAVSVSGLAATVGSAITADIADPVTVFGLPAVLPTPPTLSTVPAGIRARVLDSTGAFICHLPHTDALRWMDEFNTAGGGSIDWRRYDDLEAAHPGMWAPGTQIIITVGALDVFRLVLDADPGYRIDPDTGDRIDTWPGMGALGVLNSGMVIPEYGWRPEATEERSFDYGSNPTIGGWYVPSEWVTPVGKLVRSSWRWTFKKRHWPKGWPDSRAQWLWWTNPDSTSVPNETCYFVGDAFALSAPARVKIWAAGDDTLELQVDGEVRLTAGPGDWHKPSTVVLSLATGTHYIAAKVTNATSSTGSKNRSGFICSVGRINGDGDVTKWLLRSTPSKFKIRRQRSGPPGWFPAQVLRQLVTEAKARLCAGHAPITLGFTTTTDSSGAAWTGRQDLALPIGTLGLDYVQRMVEAGIDVAMTPGLVLNAWRSRGVDRSSYIRLDQGTAHALDEAGSPGTAIRNVLVARARTGWVQGTNAASITARGRREVVGTFGSSRSTTQTALTISQLLPDMATPPQTLEVKISGATGPQPYAHFNVGDWVGFRRAGAQTWTRHQVMSVSGEPTEAGHPDWTLQLYED